MFSNCWWPTLSVASSDEAHNATAALLQNVVSASKSHTWNLNVSQSMRNTNVIIMFLNGKSFYISFNNVVKSKGIRSHLPRFLDHISYVYDVYSLRFVVFIFIWGPIATSFVSVQSGCITLKGKSDVVYFLLFPDDSFRWDPSKIITPHAEILKVEGACPLLAVSTLMITAYIK